MSIDIVPGMLVLRRSPPENMSGITTVTVLTEKTVDISVRKSFAPLYRNSIYPCVCLFPGLPFRVNETTGEVKTTGKLDRETNSTFTFVIIVRIH